MQDAHGTPLPRIESYVTFTFRFRHIEELNVQKTVISGICNVSRCVSMHLRSDTMKVTCVRSSDTVGAGVCRDGPIITSRGTT